MDVDLTTGFIKNKEENGSLMSIDESSKIHSRSTWTAEEDRKLLMLVNESKAKNWKKIAQILGNKTGPQCSYRYNKLVTEMTKAKWNRNDDIQLLELVETYGQNWAFIANKMQGRSTEEVKYRFIMKLDPKLKRSRFEKEEDELILKLHEKYGNKWNEISKFFPNRNAAMVKNRFYSHLKNKNKDSTTLNVTGEDSLSNYSFSMTPSSSNNNYVKNNFTNNNGRNTVSYTDNNLNNFKEKMLTDYDLLDYESFNYNYNDTNNIEFRNKDIDMFVDNSSNQCFLNYNNNNFNNNIGISKNKPNWNDNDIYTEGWNTLPQDLIKVDENSPKTKLLEPEDKFKEEYNNVFKFAIKKESFGEDSPQELEANTKELSLGQQNDNESLMQQYQLLESVFKRIYEVSSHTSLDGKYLFNR
jgi:hypothetical protein